MGSVILINGASSAGKSTLALAIQAASVQPIIRLSLDQLFAGQALPKRGYDRDKFLTGYYGSLAAYANAGNTLVVDHVIEDQRGFEELMTALKGFQVFLVGLNCPLETLERRERKRGDRKIGDARRDIVRVHSFCVYDLEVDGTLPAKKNAELVLSAWRRTLNLDLALEASQGV